MKVSYDLDFADQGIFHNADGRRGERGVWYCWLLETSKSVQATARNEIWKHMAEMNAPQTHGEIAALADLVITS